MRIIALSISFEQSMEPFFELEKSKQSSQTHKMKGGNGLFSLQKNF